MRIEVLALLGVLAQSTAGQRLLRRQSAYASSNSSIAAFSNTTSSSSSSSTLIQTYSGSSPSPIPAYGSSSSSTSAGNSSSSIATYSTPSYTSTTYDFNPTPVGPGSATLGTGSSGTDVPSTTPNATVPIDNNRPQGCTGQTLNVLSASLDWWYTRTVYNVVSTFSITTNKNDSRLGWTLVPATTSFDLGSALASPTCTGTETFNTLYNQTLWDYSCFPAPTPVAASTTVLPQNAYAVPNATTGYGFPPNVVVTPAPAAITVPKSGGSYTEGTAFVFFSHYEIVTKTVATYKNGSSGCAAATKTYEMEEAFSFEYDDGDVNGTKVVGAGVTGDVNPAFLGVVGASKAKAGSWVAAPTVAVVVQNIVAEAAVFGALVRPGVTRLTTETVLQTPSATLPTFNTPTPSQTAPNNPPPPPPPPPHVESTQRQLQTPTGPNKTKPPPSPPGSPTPKPPPQPTGGSKATTSDRGGFGHAISIILSAIRPTTTTNALSVLQSALLTFTDITTHTNPTGSAILHGIDGHKPSVTPPPLGPVPNGQQNGVGSGQNGQPVVVVGGTTFTGDSSTNFVLGPGQTLSQGGIVVVHGTTVSLAPGLSSIVVNGQTLNAQPAMITPGPIIIGGTAFTPVGGSTFNIDGQTLTPGGTIIVDGTTISLASPATAVVVNGQTSQFGVPFVPAVLTVDGGTFTENSLGAFVVNGQTLTPGGIIIVDGTTVSLSPGGTAVVVDGQTSMLASGVAASITAAPTLTIGSETFTGLNGAPTYDINGETLTPGGTETVTIDGVTYIVSLARGANVLMIETENANGVVTATSYETLYAGSSPTTSTAMEGAAPSAGPSASVVPATGAASLLKMQISGICFAIGSFALAVWL